MAILLLMSAALLALSGGLKVRSGMRRGRGVTPLTVLELLVALGFVGLAATGGLATGTAARWSVPAAMLLLVVSSVAHARRERRARARRAANEGGRLAAYVRYLAPDAEGTGGVDASGEAEPTNRAGAPDGAEPRAPGGANTPESAGARADADVDGDDVDGAAPTRL